MRRLVFACLVVVFLTVISSLAQTQTATPQSSTPAITLHAASRLVTLDVVVRDHQGHSVTDLTQSDFQVFEKIAGKRDKGEQKIAVFKAVSLSQLDEKREKPVRLPPGIYTNLLTTRKDPFPPIVLLVDGLNTDSTSQMQVHSQVLKMLSAIPDNLPVAVFLLGHSLDYCRALPLTPSFSRTRFRRPRQ